MVVAAVLSVPSFAFAAEGEDATAKASFVKGTKYYDLGDYEPALQAFNLQLQTRIQISSRRKMLPT